MTKFINTQDAPQAIGPYVQAVDTGNLVFVSGQIAIDPQTGNISQNIVEQTRQVLSNIKNIVLAAGLKVENIVKTTIFLTNLDNFTIVNKEYEEFFQKNNHPKFPARSCVEISKLPKGAGIEIEVIAIK